MGFSRTNKIRMADDGSCFLDGLDDLFTIKSYEEITFTIPRGDGRRREEVSDNSSNSSSNNQGEGTDLTIQSFFFVEFQSVSGQDNFGVGSGRYRLAIDHGLLLWRPNRHCHGWQ
jgi:hypothetical protein